MTLTTWLCLAFLAAMSGHQMAHIQSLRKRVSELEAPQHRYPRKGAT